MTSIGKERPEKDGRIIAAKFHQTNQLINPKKLCQNLRDQQNKS